MAPASSRTSTTSSRSLHSNTSSDLSLEDIILRYFRACPLHRNDTKIGYIVLSEKEYQTSLGQRRDQVDQRRHRDDTWLPEPLPAHPHTSAGYRCHQLQRLPHASCWDQTTRLTSTGRRITSGRTSTSLPSPSRWMNLERGTSYDHTVETAVNIKSSNSTSPSTPPLHAPSIGNVLVILRGPTSQDIYDKVNHPGIVSSHVFDQTAIPGPLNSHAHSLISLCAHDTIWSKHIVTST